MKQTLTGDVGAELLVFTESNGRPQAAFVAEADVWRYRREIGAVVVTTAVLIDYRLSNLEKSESEIVVDLGRLLEDAANAQDLQEWAVGM